MAQSIRLGLAVLCWLWVGACAPHPIFQEQVMDGIQSDFDFSAWVRNPESSPGAKVELGGRILGTAASPDGFIIVGEQFPIVKHPAYGPAEPADRSGDYEFAFLYKGALEPTALTAGNRFIVVGRIQASRDVTVGGAVKREPFLVARCVHIWKTQGREISDFPYVGGGYYPLEEHTYCVSEAQPAQGGP